MLEITQGIVIEYGLPTLFFFLLAVVVLTVSARLIVGSQLLVLRKEVADLAKQCRLLELERTQLTSRVQPTQRPDKGRFD